MVTQLHNFKNIFITSSPDFEAISLDCQVVKRLTRALFSLLQWHRYLFALLRECPSNSVPGPGHSEFEVGLSPLGLKRKADPACSQRLNPSGTAVARLLSLHPRSCVLGALFAWSSALALTPSECPSVRRSSVQTPASPGSFFRHLITNPPASPAWDSGSLAGPEQARCSTAGISWNTPSRPFSCRSIAWHGLLPGARGPAMPLL